MSFMDSVFQGGDWLLNHGGQTALDVAGFVPGLNVVTEGVQSAYHAGHAINDAVDGNNEEALKQGGAAAWHGGLAALDFVTGEGGAVAGEAANAVGEAASVAGEVAGEAGAVAGEVGAAAGEAGAVAGEAGAAAGEAGAAAGDAAGEGSSLLSRAWDATGGKMIKEVGEKGLGGAMMDDFGELATKAGETNSLGLGLTAAAKASGEVLDLGIDAVSNGINIATGSNKALPSTGELPGAVVAAAAGIENHNPAALGEAPEAAEGGAE